MHFLKVSKKATTKSHYFFYNINQCLNGHTHFAADSQIAAFKGLQSNTCRQIVVVGANNP